MEFMIGRQLALNLVNIDLYDPFKEALKNLDQDLDDLCNYEPE